MKISKIAAIIRSFLWLTSLARGFTIRILLFGYMEVDYSLSMLLSNPTTLLVDCADILSEIHPIFMVDSLIKK